MLIRGPQGLIVVDTSLRRLEMVGGNGGMVVDD